MEKKYCTAVVLAAGKGSRMGGNTAKQYMEIGGKPLVAYALILLFFAAQKYFVEGIATSGLKG